MFCRKCGAKIEGNENFCSNCGAKIPEDNDSINKTDNKSETAGQSEKVIGKSRSKYISASIILLIFVGVMGYLFYPAAFHNVNNSTTSSSNTKDAAETESSDEQPVSSQQAAINISQINTDNFPLIKVYFSVNDNNGNSINDIEDKYFSLYEEDKDKTYSDQEIISDLKFLGENTSVNLNLVMDVSGSMDGQKIQQAKNAAGSFLDIVNFNAGDQIEIISFDDTIGISHPFSNDKQSLNSAINNLTTGGQTAFYDSLYTALAETNKQFGHKCVIAFTDGQDNKSHYTENDIVQLSRQLSIPVYIIGIGNDVENKDLEGLSQQTGGYYKYISDINDLKGIYEDIFKNQKSQYVLTYTSKNAQVSDVWRTINLKLNTDKYSAEAEKQFIPKQAVKTDTSKIAVNNSYSSSTVLDNNLKEELMNTINSYNSYWFTAMSNKNAELIMNATDNEKNRTNGLIQNMKSSGKSYVGYMTKTTFDLDSVTVNQENGMTIAYISDCEEFCDIYYTEPGADPLPNKKLWKYKMVYDTNTCKWLVDSHIALDTFNPVNKREY